jgi:hypothetical protein
MEKLLGEKVTVTTRTSFYKYQVKNQGHQTDSQISLPVDTSRNIVQKNYAKMTVKNGKKLIYSTTI